MNTIISNILTSIFGIEAYERLTNRIAAEPQLFRDFKQLERKDSATNLPLLIYESIYAVMPYQHPLVKSLVYSLKYTKNRHSRHIIAMVILQVLKNLAESGRFPLPFIIVPMPSSRARLRERGFNQCLDLVHTIKHLSKINGPHSIFLFISLLHRPKDIPHQVHSDRTERLSRIHGIFEVSERELTKFTHGTLIVIDDVTTTGSSLTEARSTLRAHTKLAHFTSIGLAFAH